MADYTLNQVNDMYVDVLKEIEILVPEMQQLQWQIC